MTKPTKRYNLNIPQDLFDQVQAIADAKQTSVVDMLRRFIMLGLLAVKLEETPGAELQIVEGETVKRIILL